MALKVNNHINLHIITGTHLQLGRLGQCVSKCLVQGYYAMNLDLGTKVNSSTGDLTRIV